MEGMEGIAHNPPALKTRKGFKLLRSSSEAVAHKTRKGFNLIESAVVLAVVGGVIGGIWYAAAAVTENRKVIETEKGILTIAHHAQNLFSQRTSSYLTDGQNISAAIKNTGGFPEDWPYKTDTPVVGGVAVITPIGGYLYVRHSAESSDNAILITIRGLPKPICAKLVNRLAPRVTPYHGLMLKLIRIKSDTQYTNIALDGLEPQNVNLQVALEKCSFSLSDNWIHLFFTHTRIN